MKICCKRLFCAALTLVLPQLTTSADALSYGGSSSYRSGKYYKNLTKVKLTGNQRTAVVNVAKPQIGYQKGNYGQLSGTVRCKSNYTEYGRWYGLQDMWCAMFVSWCANIRHQGGYGPLKRVLGKTKAPCTLDNIYAALKTDTGNQVGAYKSRQKMVYKALKPYI